MCSWVSIRQESFPPSRRRSLLPLALVCLVASACNNHPVTPVELDGSSAPVQALPIEVNKKIDVLVVVDNSISMAEEQENLAANFEPFIEHLEAVGADYRIAITTTDVGGAGRPSSLGPILGGHLRASSCLERLGEFTPMDVAKPISIEIDHYWSLEADLTALIPGVERTGNRSVRFQSPDALEAYRTFLAAYYIRQGVAQGS